MGDGLMTQLQKEREIINDTNFWTEYKLGLCGGCAALCCRMRVEATLDDLVQMELVTPMEALGPVKRIARKLRQRGIIEDHNQTRTTFTLARRANDDCIFLGEESRRCTIYETRPETCRNHPEVGPRPGFCPHSAIT